jgi:hypothetical protein
MVSKLHALPEGNGSMSKPEAVARLSRGLSRGEAITC